MGNQNLRFEDLPDYLTVKELRQWLRIGTNKAYQLANTPGFPCLKFGRKKVFPKQQVREWLERQARYGNLSKKLRVLVSS
jgi:excisionase family DNA binding protein